MYRSPRTSIVLAAVAAVLAAGCADPLRSGPAGTPAALGIWDTQTSGVHLRDVAARGRLLIGAAVWAPLMFPDMGRNHWSGDPTQFWNGDHFLTLELDAAYRAAANNEFNYLTPAVHFWWGALTPEKADFEGGVQGGLPCANRSVTDTMRPVSHHYCLEETQAIIDHANRYGMKVHLPAIIRWNSVPDWIAVPNQSANKQQSDEVLKVSPALLNVYFRQHIQNLVRYADQNGVHAIDVVNEAVRDSMVSDAIRVGVPTPNPFDALRTIAPSMGIVGDGFAYVEMAFRYARELNPHVKLYINEAGIEWGWSRPDEKAAVFYDLVKRLNDRGLVDGVGFQMHFGQEYRPQAAQIELELRRYADLGLNVQITEIDYGITSPALDSQQAEFYRDVVQACLNVAACEAVTTWGVSDDWWWKRDRYASGLMLDENKRPRTAHAAVVRTLAGDRSVFGDFSEQCYLAINHDVWPRVADGTFTSGHDHWVQYGQSEQRRTRCITPGFDEAFYLARYPDVRGAVTNGVFRSGLSHYEQYGYQEHRDAALPEFCYLAAHPDVAALVRAGVFTNARDHYLQYGASEGRVTGCGQAVVWTRSR